MKARSSETTSDEGDKSINVDGLLMTIAKVVLF